jgi:HAE1 family hydrophobic/amphiphilic exporter-1
VGSSYVNQFNKFGRTFQVYVQADSKFRLLPGDIEKLYVRTQDNKMVPLGALVQVRPMVGPALVGLYNLYPTATIIGFAAQGFSSGEAINLMEQIADKTVPRGAGYDWTAMSYQEKLVGSSTYFVFALAILLVFFVLAGQYESWVTPAAVILGVPLALLGTVSALLGLGVANNLYVQIGLVLLIALSAKNAILIVEMALEGRAAGQSLIEATVRASAVRFRPIVMTSFTFILGVLPLLLASGAGASARKSLGLAVASGMLASTCLAVLFVPTFFVVIRGWAERREASRAPVPATDPAGG